MKKTLFSVVCMLLFAVVANAQFFVGGNIGFSSEGGSESVAGTSVDKDKTTAFTFSPKAGYILSENLYVGLQLAFMTDKVKDSDGNYESSNDFVIAPFARYYAFRADKFGVFGQGQIGLGFGSSEEKALGVTTDGPKSTSFGLAVFPGLSYNLTDKIELEAVISGLNLSFWSETEKTDLGNGNEYVDKTSAFEFGANMDHILTTGTVTIGLIIKL